MKVYIEYYVIKFKLMILKLRLYAVNLDMAIDRFLMRFLIRILFELKIAINTYAYNKDTNKHYNLDYAVYLDKIYSRKYNR